MEPIERGGLIERHQQGELTAGQSDWTQCLVETARQGTGHTLSRQTQAVVAHIFRRLEGDGFEL